MSDRNFNVYSLYFDSINKFKVFQSYFIDCVVLRDDDDGRYDYRNTHLDDMTILDIAEVDLKVVTRWYSCGAVILAKYEVGVGDVSRATNLKSWTVHPPRKKITKTTIASGYQNITATTVIERHSRKSDQPVD